ncbi:putative quinol monooxygenase [Dyadobacter subterraneus]|uniref:Antibiotic biosynthesis monooxygenase n=1 Tax=Dyadobacter subterraneus TaxID=2773304 RepID=A0ABR9WB56_9BACT|nr:putative quinol monooxygenase [Dyadobacter subterraneus]MBE9462703.1 antibiotic biosynthesis monooxygenase [Dyadobacter subterraneus]
MSSLKYIVMAQVSVQPEHLQEVIALSAKTLKLTLEEPGCEAFYQTCKTDDPHTLVFFEVFTSREAFDLHMAADYTRAFFDGVKDKVSAKPESVTLQQL